MSRYNRFRNSLTGYSSSSGGSNPFELEDSTGNRLKSFGSRFFGPWLSKIGNFMSELGISEGITNWWKGFTGSGLTQRDIELNQMNMQNVEDTAEAQTKGYIKAGVNPALMYGNSGQQTAPQSSSTGGSGSLSDLMSFILLPKQMKMMDAQTRNIDAQSQKTMADTQQVKLALEYYPQLTEETIAEIVSRRNLNLSNVSRNDIQNEIDAFNKIIKENESKYSDEFFKWRNEYEKAQTQEAKDNAALAAARAAWQAYETKFTKDHNGARPSSSSLLALAEAISSLFGLDGDAQKGLIPRVVNEVVHNPISESQQQKNKEYSSKMKKKYLSFRKQVRGHGLVIPD